MKKCILVMSMCLLPSMLFAENLELNGIAAATMNSACKITALTATSNSVTVTWTERYSDGTMVMKYGTTNPPTTSRAVSASERGTRKVVISNLQESTTYYVEIVATKTGYTQYGANGSVTTLSTTAVKNFNIADNTMVTVIQNDRSINVLSNHLFSDNASMQLFNAVGANVNVQNKIFENNRNQISFSTDGLASGRYILKVNANGTSIDRVIIIK